jgi:hypothetical protein
MSPNSLPTLRMHSSKGLSRWVVFTIMLFPLGTTTAGRPDVADAVDCSGLGGIGNGKEPGALRECFRTGLSTWASINAQPGPTSLSVVLHPG